ncbi:hypothetical protein ACFPJ1_40960 [Kribbella qitaiheensis]|uniref:hypothetical protein n=1 Tax=Kribbella qitaiheensis TaxID=1544730 RepID=UPI00361A470A
MRERRGVVGADALVSLSGKKLKQPFAIRPADGSTTLALAGLYEVWYDKSLPDDDPNRVIPTEAGRR